VDDLSIEAFLTLRDYFFDQQGKPIPFSLRPKRNTQDDPFDELLAVDILSKMSNVKCVKAPGPLITPDLVLFRENCLSVMKDDLREDFHKILAIEVKKLERTSQGGVARASGLDYNTTPPCGIVRVYDSIGKIIDIRGFYLYVCLELHKNDPFKVFLSALALVDGNLLNTDFNLYLNVVGERKKKINLGSYADGADRARPMLIFANPLGAEALDHNISLVHPSANLKDSRLRLVCEIERTLPNASKNKFYCYRAINDVPKDWQISSLRDPFPMPSRDARTRPRGRFKLPFKVNS
jgi:hypothetical protein